MMSYGWTKERVEEIDRIANAPGQPEPKTGQGRNWLRAQHGGWYELVDGHGAAPETERRPENIPEYVHDRNAHRRAETALATGRCPEPGREKAGYGAKGKPKGGKGDDRPEPGKGKGEKRPWQAPDRSWGAQRLGTAATWSTTTASTWGSSNGE